MDMTALIDAREAAYVDDDGTYNTAIELLALRKCGYLLGGEAEGTARDWTAPESAEIKGEYRENAEHREALSEWFPGECAETQSEQ